MVNGEAGVPGEPVLVHARDDARRDARTGGPLGDDGAEVHGSACQAEAVHELGPAQDCRDAQARRVLRVPVAQHDCRSADCRASVDARPQQCACRVPAERRGRLPWPLAGKVAVGFGSSDDSGRAISGIVLAAATGAEVRAVSHGRVAYADWLKGYGLILILDHGDGYMSLYGYNESLLKDVGDWVDAGEAIATAGSSGGRQNAGLYFELRARGKPLDPRSWLKPGP